MAFCVKSGLLRVAAALMLCMIAALAIADGNIRLQSYPNITVADGRSTLTISAEVRDRNGRIVPNGTQVVFTSTLGTFSDPVARTSNGLARVVFTAGQVPGTATIRASALSFNAVSTLDIELVTDRSQLSMAKEYIELVATNDLVYNVDEKLIGASGPNQGVSLRYREVEIEADDLQLNVPMYEVRARRARLRIGDKFDQEFKELYFKLNSREGYGTTTMMVPNYEIVGQGRSFRFESAPRERFGLAKISRSGPRPTTDNIPTALFDFADVLDATSTITARKVVAYPRGNIQFHRADMYVGANRVMRMPLFQLNMFGATPLITDQVVNVYDNQLSVNYPHYLSLKPGETSLLRVRTGERFGRSFSASTGLFLDYELNWNRGDNMDGGLVVSGLARKDWSVGLRQSLRPNDRTNINAQLDFPANRALYGSLNFNHKLNGFSLGLSANAGRTVRGPKFENQSYTAILESDPVRFGSLPFQMFYGLSATSQASTTETRITTGTGTTIAQRRVAQESAGIRSRFQMLPIRLDSATNLSASMVLSKQVGTNVPSDFSTLADVSLSRDFGRGASVFMTYNFARDGYTSKLTGMHNLNVTAAYDAGRSSLAVVANRSLDIDRLGYFVDASYRVSGLWRTSYSMTFDQYLGERFLEDRFMLSYRLGVREIGVTYSIRDKRLGFQVFGTQFN